ncbi:MAG: RNA methyltransferase [Bdellovibrionales bacterium]
MGETFCVSCLRRNNNRNNNRGNELTLRAFEARHNVRQGVKFVAHVLILCLFRHEKQGQLLVKIFAAGAEYIYIRIMLESAQNDTFKKLLSLTSSKGLKEEGLFLLSGEKLIREFLKKPNLKIIGEITAPKQTPLVKDAKLVELSASLFDQVDVLGTHFNILVLEQPLIPVLTAEDMAAYTPNGIEVVAPTGDPGNLGALIRSCEAFSVRRVILSREAAHPFLPKAVKASAGSVLRVNLARGPALADFPPSCIALDMDGVSINDFKWPSKALLLLGEEGPGLDASRFHTRVRIPTTGVESLNAVVAASIALSRLPEQKN